MRVFAVLLLATLSCVCADQTFRIIGTDGTVGLKLANYTENNPQLNVTVGEKITFSIESLLIDESGLEFRRFAVGLSENVLSGPTDLSSAAKGGLKASSACTANADGLSWYTTNVSTPCILTWTVFQPAAGENVYYRANSTQILGAIFNIAPASSTPTTTTAPTTATPTTPGTPTTTVAPTIKPGSSTGGNGVATLVPGVVAMIIAAINALFSA